jgi:predicted mannosyl-3-phosphoglycerate phosphatase (HAD superfamily)
MSHAKLVIFSAADSVLRHPHAGDLFGKAARVLGPLQQADVPIVLCSRKTRAEIEQIQHELGINHPFVCERDGAVFIPARYFSFDVPRAREVAGYQAVEFGMPYTDVVGALHHTARRLAIEVVGFNDMSVEEVAAACDLPLPQARLAMLLEYGEHFRVLGPFGDARHRLFKALASAGLRCEPGTPYNHVGAPVRNGTGVKFLCSLYERAHGALLSLGLSDKAADAGILPLVDRPVVVCDDLCVNRRIDVVGWAEAIVESVEDLRAEAK